MDEQTWLACTDPWRMLEFLRGKVSDRKLRLFACACCRRIWHLLTDERSRQAVIVAERYADKLATREELAAAWTAARDAARDAASDAAWNAEIVQQCRLLREIVGNPFRPVTTVKQYLTNPQTHYLLRSVVRPKMESLVQSGYKAMRRAFSAEIEKHLLRPEHVTPTVLAIATTIDAEQRWGDMPVLADALEEAECCNEEILSHCRLGQGHIRGCWVIDLILGKE